MSTTNELALPLTAALYYARKGWRVLPVWEPVKAADGYGCSCPKPDCNSVGKHPCVDGGVKSATTDEATIQGWWAACPSANVGVAAGAASGLLVIDIDPPHGGSTTLEALEAELGPLPETLTTWTGGGGAHLFFRHPGGLVRNSAGKLGDGIDIRADGGYVVVQPSIHASGNPYVFENPEAPLADLPPAWLARLETGSGSLDKADSIASDDGRTIPEGKRNNQLTSIAGSLRLMGMNEDTITNTMLDINATQCNPPLPAEEVQGIAQSVCRYPAGAAVKKPSMSQADLLVEIATANAELFHTAGGHDTDGYASIEEKGVRQTWRIKSGGFRQWLSHQFYTVHNKAPGSQALQDALNTIAGQAIHAGKEYPVAVRAAGLGDTIFIDLADDQWRVVAIDKNGWQVLASDAVPVRFIRRRGMLTLPEPEHGGVVDELRPLVNLPDDDAWMLFVGWLLMAFSPTGPYPVLAVNGEQGSAKSTLCRFARLLIDPNEAPLRRPPRDERDLMIAASNGWLVAFDNLSGIRPDLSDALCCLATGGGFSTRELYSDDDEKLFNAQRPVAVNGIDDLATRSDLADRAIHLILPVISPERREIQSELERRFDAARPRILGALLDAVAVALGNRLSVNLPAMPRMADFATWVTAAESQLGWQPGAFLAAYERNRDQSSANAIEGAIVGTALLRFLGRSPCWAGTAMQLLAALDRDSANLEDKRRQGWPRSARGMSGALRRLSPNLRAVGISVGFGDEGTGNDKQRIIRFGKQP